MIFAFNLGQKYSWWITEGPHLLLNHFKCFAKLCLSDCANYLVLWEKLTTFRDVAKYLTQTNGKILSQFSLNPILTEFVMFLASPPQRHPFDDLWPDHTLISKSVLIFANSANPDETPHLGLRCLYMRCDMGFPTMWYVRPPKPPISLRIRAVWPETLLVAWIIETGWTSFGVSKLKRRLHRSVWVYTYVTLLEIT